MNSININQKFKMGVSYYIITRITPLTIFYKPCKTFKQAEFNKSVTFYSVSDYDYYYSLMDQPSDTAIESKILINRFLNSNYKLINYSLFGRVFKNSLLLEDVFVDTCEAFIDPERLRKKYELYVKLTFLKFDNAPKNEEASKLKVLSIHKLKNLFNSNQNEYTLLLNEMSEDENKRFLNQPQFHTNYLNLYNTLTSNENKQKYKIIIELANQPNMNINH